MIEATISEHPVLVKNQSYSLGNPLESRTLLKFTVIDSDGSASYSRGEPVTFDDPVEGLSFEGFVLSSKPEKLGPGTATIFHEITCMDNQYRLDKRANKKNYFNTFAGDIVADMIDKTLVEEGVYGRYAIRRDSSVADFGQGMLTNVSAVPDKDDGVLELTRSGSDLTILETTQGDFSTGTLTNVTAQANGSLTPTLSTALKLSVTGNGTIQIVIWKGSQVIGTNDHLLFDVWVGGSINFLCSDNSRYEQNPGTDGVPNPGFGWWSRNITLPSFWNGKTIVQVMIVYTVNAPNGASTYFRNIRLQSAPGNPFFSTSLNIPAPYATKLTGYSEANTEVVQTYNPYAATERLSPAYSLSSVGQLRHAFLAYIAVVPDKTTLTIKATTDDGATWQDCPNNTMLPMLLPGTNLSGKTVQFREIFGIVAGETPDPTQYPQLHELKLSVASAALCTPKTDVQYTAHTQADWQAGTLSNNVAIVNNSLTIPGRTTIGAFTPFDNGGFTYEVISGSIFVDFPTDGGAKRSHIRLTEAGTYSSMTLLVSLNFDTAFPEPTPTAGAIVGVTYLSPQFNASTNTFGYFVRVHSVPVGQFDHNVFVTLLRGSAGGSVTTLAGPTLVPEAGVSVQLRIVYNAGVHKVWATTFGTEYFMFQVTDNTYTTPANIGFYATNPGGEPNGFDVSCSFGAFQITPNATGVGTFVSPTTNLAPIGTCGNSLVVWDVLKPSVLTNVTVETSLDNGSTWDFATSGAAVPDLPPGTNMSGKNLKVRVSLLSEVITNIATVTGLRVIILGLYKSTGERSTIPLGNDTMIRPDVVGSFGTSFDGQSYSKIGTGTTNLTANKALITNTSGDVHMRLGSRTTEDQEGTMRFSLSAATIEAGMELRFSDANNFYRFSVTTSSLLLFKYSQSTPFVLAFVAPPMMLSTGVLYRMRFRITGASPVALFGKIWQDGTEEPEDWTITAID